MHDQKGYNEYTGHKMERNFDQSKPTSNLTIDDQTENRSINTHQTPSLPTTTKMQNQTYNGQMQL